MVSICGDLGNLAVSKERVGHLEPARRILPTKMMTLVCNFNIILRLCSYNYYDIV